MPKHFVYEELISFNEMKELYITKNMTKKQISEKTGIKERTLDRIIQKYGLVKSKEMQVVAMKKTNLEKYGVEYPTQNEKVREKMSINSKANDKSVKEKRAKTNKERYGVENTFQSEEIKNKIKKTNLERYGCEYAQSNEGIKAKMQKNITATLLSKYGVPNAMNVDEFKEKRAKTNLERYGETAYLKTQEGRDKFTSTMLTKYGVATPMENLKIAKKATENHNKTMIKKYGIPYISALNKDTDIVNKFNDDIAFSEFIKENFSGRSIYEIANEINYSYSRVQQRIKELNLQDIIIMKPQYSKYEDEIIVYLNSLGVICEKNNRSLLNGQEIDIYVAEKNLGIEFDGNYWHSDAIKNKSYHQKKSLLAESKGIKLIHIYEYEWSDPEIQKKIKSILKIAVGKLDKKIYARECEIRKITNSEAKPFNEVNHLQGHRGALVTYGLFFNNELVQLMSFSHHTKYEWEIIRGCPGSNNVVVGGVGKLFKCFIKEYNPNQIFSYCDFNKFDGNSYENIGMKFIGLTQPDKTYIVGKTGVKRNVSRAKELDEIAKGVIWGAGSKKYLWMKDKKEED